MSVDQAHLMSRFDTRWHLIGGGLSNLWRFGDLELPAASGRLLLRGPNGTGKTTALEALAPFLLDLNAARMSAGKARTTTLSSLMREGIVGKRRLGYAWLTLAERAEGVWSFGIRIQYSDGASPPVKVIPFCVRGRPLHELVLYGVARSALTVEQFTQAVATCGGQIFEDEDVYVGHLAVHVFNRPNREDVVTLAGRLRQVRNPTLLGDVSSQAAADALRESLPGVAEEVIAATAAALAESNATREAFTRDKEAAEVLEDFRTVWCAHATDVVKTSHKSAVEAADRLQTQTSTVRMLAVKLTTATTEAAQAKQHAERIDAEIETAQTELWALENQDAYRDAGRLADLRNSADAKQRAAVSAVRTLEAAVHSVASARQSLARELEHLREDLEEERGKARAVSAGADDGTPLLEWTLRPRPSLRAGEVVVNPGPELVIQGDAARLRRTAVAWQSVAQHHAQRADAAAVALIDHRDVERLQKEAEDKAKVASDAYTAAETASRDAASAKTMAQESAWRLLDLFRPWTQQNPRLTEAHSASDGAGQTGRESLWSIEDVELLVAAEPGQVLEACDGWAQHALTRAESLAGEFHARAKQHVSNALRLREEARAFREQAESLRSGRLLPLPRPDWAGEGDDTIALGAALDWRDHFDDPHARALLEEALAAAGLLGASLGHNGVNTRCWRVESSGPLVTPNLSEVIGVDTAHPLASVAAAVLARVPLAESAPDVPDADSASPLCLGLNGTFSAGVLRGRVRGADDPTLLAPASHIGARQRRAAALARAAMLEDRAEGLEAQAMVQDGEAARLERDAEEVSALGRTVPSREALRGAESRRAELSRIAHDARESADMLQDEYQRAARQHERARGDWSERTRSRRLPDDIEQLIHLRDNGKRLADTLRAAAAPLEGKLAERLDRLIAGYSAKDTADKLIQSESEAQETFREATHAATAVRVLEETAGAAIEEILQRHRDTEKRLSDLRKDSSPAKTREVNTAKAQAAAESDHTEAERKLHDEVKPNAVRQLAALRGILDVPGVADAVLDGQPPDDGEQLVEQLEAALRGRRTLTMKTLLERADAAKAKLAGIWALDPGDNHGELLTFVLTYRDATYTPIQAAAHAETLKARAEQALAASEERALRDFVIGRLPSAIGTAWTSLQDWVVEVNRKMRSAAASSGVGVQVRTPLRDDLTPAERTVYELSCIVSSAERTEEQQRRLGDALQSLLASAPGETMLPRLAAAVNIREWVEVHYEVTRPGGTKQRWNSKTGLSGGERRLVVLAPMLAAIAAAYDRFGPKTLRLVTLDEVPAEVDDRGREGLARYIAELDLDLICTSYLWDGCPGAWDGIDAHDLEAGSDGTVVAFPMLVRGISPVPEVTTSEGKLVPLERLQ
jgi:hypothetical protein